MEYELLAGDDCPQGDICSSIRRGHPGEVIVTGKAITDPRRSPSSTPVPVRARSSLTRPCWLRQRAL